MTSSFLIDEQPLYILPALAIAIGLNEAILLQQIHFWLKHKERDSRKYESSFREGRWWVYNSIDEWRQDSFQFWSCRTIQRGLASLKDQNVIIVQQFGKSEWDRTNWYTIDYDHLEHLTGALSESVRSKVPDRHDRIRQNGMIDNARAAQSTMPVSRGRKSQSVSVEHTDLALSPSEESSNKTQRNLQIPDIAQSLVKEPDSSIGQRFSSHIKTVDNADPSSAHWQVYCSKKISVDLARENTGVRLCYLRNWFKITPSKQIELMHLPVFAELATTVKG